MDNDDSEDAPKMKINISNRNPKSQIVLNDLRLLELIHMYPFLYSKAVDPQDDKDYEEWGWDQIAKAFNYSYEDMNLSTPFSIEVLRRRWDILRPLCALPTEKLSQFPPQLRSIMCKISKLMNLKSRVTVKGVSPTQLFFLNQLPFIEQLPPTLQKQMEVEVLDAIFIEEREGRSVGKFLGEKETELLQSEYDEFFKIISVNELPMRATSRKSSISSNSRISPEDIKATESIPNGHDEALVIRKVHPKLKPKHPPPEPQQQQVEPNFLQPESVCPQLKTHHSKIVAQPLHQNLIPEYPQPELSTQQLHIKEEPIFLLEVAKQEVQKQQKWEPSPIHDLQLRYVPLKSIKNYVKRVRVRVKRLDIKDLFSLPKVRRKRRCRR